MLKYFMHFDKLSLILISQLLNDNYLCIRPPQRTNQSPTTALISRIYRYVLACVFPGAFHGYVPAVLRYCLIGHKTNRQTDGKRSIVNFCTPMACREQHWTWGPIEGRPLAEMSCSIQLSSRATGDSLLFRGCFGENGTMSQGEMKIL